MHVTRDFSLSKSIFQLNTTSFYTAGAPDISKTEKDFLNHGYSDYMYLWLDKTLSCDFIVVSGDGKDLQDLTLHSTEAALHVTQKSGSPYSFHILPDHRVKAFSRPYFLTPTILISLFDRPMLCQGLHTYKWIKNECTWAQLRTLVGKTGRRRGQLLTYAVIIGEKPDSVICRPHLLSLLVMWPWFCH